VDRDFGAYVSILKYLILTLSLMLAASAFGDVHDFQVIGVIADTGTKDGVVLFKNTKTNKVFAVKAADQIEPGLSVASVSKKWVVLKTAERTWEISVGTGATQVADSPSGSGQGSAVPTTNYAAGMERNGDTLLVQAALKQDLIENKLGNILMEAAATPHIENGRLAGFKLTDIVPGSIFEAFGFVNGDVVTHINGQPLTDAATSVRLLNQIKDQNEADVTFLRQNASQNIKIVIK
jgi:type II secretion system protein C